MVNNKLNISEEERKQRRNKQKSESKRKIKLKNPEKWKQNIKDQMSRYRRNNKTYTTKANKKRKGELRKQRHPAAWARSQMLGKHWARKCVKI